MSKRRHIKVVAVPQDPVVLSRLVRVLLTQATLEITQQRLRRERPTPPAAPEEQASG